MYFKGTVERLDRQRFDQTVNCGFISISKSLVVLMSVNIFFSVYTNKSFTIHHMCFREFSDLIKVFKILSMKHKNKKLNKKQPKFLKGAWCRMKKKNLMSDAACAESNYSKNS